MVLEKLTIQIQAPTYNHIYNNKRNNTQVTEILRSIDIFLNVFIKMRKYL